MDNNLKLEYLNHFHKANLKYWLKEKDLYEDDPNQNLYERQWWLMWIKSALCKILIDSQSRIIFFDEEKNNEIVQRLIEKLKTWNILIITNHATFAWYPILINHLSNVAQEKWIENIQDNIFTILWPLLLTNKPQRNFILSFSNCLKTIPQSLIKSNILSKEFEWYLWKITKWFLIQLKKLIKWKGNIFIVSPTWTRDLVIRNNSTGNAEKICFENDWWISPSIRLLQLMANQWVDIVFAWVNDSWLKNPKYVDEKNNKWTYSNIYVDLAYYTSEDFLWLIDQWIVMDTLSSLIYDHNNINIWSTMASDKLKIAKDRINSIKFKKEDDQYFQTLKRKTIRKLFNLFS